MAVLRTIPVARTLAHSTHAFARPLARSPLLPSSLTSLARPLTSPAAFSTSALARATASKALGSSAGSGQGGKAEKEAARKAKAAAQKEKERAAKEKAKEKERKEKERDKARAAKEKERARNAREKEKEERRKEREKEKKEAAKERNRKAKERIKLKEKKAASTRSRLTPPKAPQNVWSLFFNDYLTQWKSSHPDAKVVVADLTKEAQPVYRSLPEAERAALQARYDEQRREYPAILEAWQATLTPEMIKEENLVRARRRKLGLSTRKGLKLPLEPKRPLTPFIVFSKEVHAKGMDAPEFGGETDMLKQGTKLAEAWRAMSAEEKKPYEDAYAADRERYAREKAEFDAQQAKKSGTGTTSATL
ncbi:hypothetical protein JCM8547_009163 [Rhodosporidiobolus lusitaniae]